MGIKIKPKIRIKKDSGMITLEFSKSNDSYKLPTRHESESEKKLNRLQKILKGKKF